MEFMILKIEISLKIDIRSGREEIVNKYVTVKTKIDHLEKVLRVRKITDVKNTMDGTNGWKDITTKDTRLARR